MRIHGLSILLVPLVCAGCATRQPASVAPVPVATVTTVHPAGAVVTRYELGAYRYPPARTEADQSMIERTTRLQAGVAPAVEATGFAYRPASFAPLPPDAELAAERAAQRDITARLLAAEEALARLAHQVRGQLNGLIAQSQETVAMRKQLENERERLLQLQREALEHQNEAAVRRPPVKAPAAETTASPEVKW